MKHLKILTVLALFILHPAAQGAWGDAADLKGLEKKAMKGDYQAQRNLAFELSSSGPQNLPINPILGCAWYMVILQSGNPKVYGADIDNVKVYCSHLDDLSRIAADNQAKTLLNKIYPNQH